MSRPTTAEYTSEPPTASRRENRCMDAPGGLDPPSDAVAIERLRTEAKTWINAVVLQAGRIDRRHRKRHLEPEAVEALEIDLHFFLVALDRLRRCVNRAGGHLSDLAAELDSHIADFDGAVPALMKLRNVAAHVDEYNLDRGRDSSVSRRQVQIWFMDSSVDGGLVWGWLGERLDVLVAEGAARRLYAAFTGACDLWTSSSTRSQRPR
jgi:hypothetical protein